MSLDAPADEENLRLWVLEAERRLQRPQGREGEGGARGRGLSKSAGGHLMRRITFHEEAGDAEVYEAALYYEDRAPNLGLAFLDETEKASQRIWPTLWPTTPLATNSDRRQSRVSRTVP